MLQPGNELHGFTVRSTEALSEIDGHAIVMDHAHSGAKLLYLQNDDENKAFSIAFKTPPADNTGVFHILEHSVLCGSEKFPVKEPFVNLLRTSMQTFLNAFTLPDKTMYPVASTNEQDLLNLMDVYLDAVLHPLLHTDQHIFEQEGWHYELVDVAVQPEDEAAGAAIELNGETASAATQPIPQQDRQLVYNGVVFNEMKGALADPESVLYHAVNRALFPDACYAFESGGHPRSIPQLTYEDYCDAHRRHYRLDNSYIVLYGDLNIARVLSFLNDNYLGVMQEADDRRQIPALKDNDSRSEEEVGTPRSTDLCLKPNPLGVITPVTSFDNVVEMLTSPENACIGLGYVVGPSHDFDRVLAADVLLDALMGGNEAPIKRAVLDAQLGGDCTAYLIDSQVHPVALFMLKNAKPGVAGQFREIIENEVRKLVEGGIPRDVLEASLAQMAFYLRERDRGMADGVVLAMSALSGWLYDDADATRYLHYEDALATMRAGLGARYFEDILAALVLESTHAAMVELKPIAESTNEEAAELAAKQASLSEADLETIDARVKALRIRQEAPDSPTSLAGLPQLRINDIGPAKPDPAMDVRTEGPLPCLFHNLPTRRINYLYAYFNLQHLNWDDVPYVTILAMLLGNLDTEVRTAAELDVHVRQHLGRLNFFTDTHLDHSNPEQFSFAFAVGASALAENVSHLVSIPQEVWATTRFTDKARMRDLLVQKRIMLEDSFLNEGHARAMMRASSYLFSSGVLAEALGGVDFYLFLKDIIDHFDERFDALVQRLEDVRSRVFQADNCTLSFTGSEEELDAFWCAWEAAGGFVCACACDTEDEGARENEGEGSHEDKRKSTGEGTSEGLVIPKPTNKREAFITPTDVCFVAKAGCVDATSYDGTWTILSRVMGFDYLWNEVRVKGGAYGCGFRSSQSGHARFYSFCDPQLDASLQRFDEAGKWLADFDPNKDEMEGYIVSSVATHDAPQKPRAIARRQDAAYFAHRPADWRSHLRETMLAATPEAVRSLAPRLDRLATSEAVCVFGNADIVNAAATQLTPVDILGSQG